MHHMSPFKRILQYVGPYKSSVALNVLFNLFSIAFSLVSIGLVIPVLQIIFGQAVEIPTEAGLFNELKAWFYTLILEVVEEAGPSNALFFVALWVIGAFFFKNLFNYLALYAIAPLRNGVTKDIRRDMHNKILELPLSYFSDQRKGDLMSRMTSDLKEIEWSMLMTIESVFREPIMIIGSLVVLLWMSAKLTVFVLVLLPVVSILVALIGKSLRRSSGKAQQQMGQLMSLAEESISGLRILKAFNAEPLKQRGFDNQNTEYFRTMNRVLRKHDLASPVSEVFGTMVMAVVIWFGGGLVLEGGDFSAEQFIAYILFFYQMIPPAKALSKTSYHIKRGNASAERVMEVLDAQNPIVDVPNAQTIASFQDAVRFSDVSFAYGEEKVLKGINLEVKKGQTVALVGLSGSGKTTLANLVPRFYDISSGSLTVDGQEVRDLKIRDLRNLLGVVSQESILFNDTVFNNIALGKPEASQEEVMHAAKIANAHEFITELPDGYQTNIGDGGSKLSGGQRQRLSIARAVLKNPPILILDEATSALDTQSERLVQDALNKLMQNRTTLVIAHRLSTIQHAHQIVVMDQGVVVEQGTHDELLANKGRYAQLCEMQSFS